MRNLVVAALILMLAPVAAAQGPDDRDMVLEEPTRLSNGNQLTVNGGKLVWCAARIDQEFGPDGLQEFPATRPEGGGFHTIDLTGYEGTVTVTGTCRREVGGVVYQSGESNALPRTFRVESPQPTVVD
jgi:hypothetical protein